MSSCSEVRAHSTVEAYFDPDTGEALYRIVHTFERHGHRVPKGMLTDGASVPWMFWVLTYRPMHAIVMDASAIHDMHYTTHDVTRPEADELFERILLEDGAKPYKAKLMYWAVRMFGWYAWRKRSARGMRCV